MKKLIAILVAFSISSFMYAGEKKEAPKKDEKKPAAIEVKAACGGCIYKMEGVKGCKTAIIIDKKNVLLVGEGEKAHGLGLCKTEKSAKVEGKLGKDGKFHSTKFTIDKKEDDKKKDDKKKDHK